MNAHNFNFKFMKIITAYPGFHVLEAIVDDTGRPVEACKCPVVAWAFEEGSGVPYPVTLDGVQTESAYILQPDGTVERPYIDGFTSVADWLTGQQHEHAAKKGRAL